MEVVSDIKAVPELAAITAATSSCGEAIKYYVVQKSMAVNVSANSDTALLYSLYRFMKFFIDALKRQGALSWFYASTLRRRTSLLLRCCFTHFLLKTIAFECISSFKN